MNDGANESGVRPVCVVPDGIGFNGHLPPGRVCARAGLRAAGGSRGGAAAARSLSGLGARNDPSARGAETVQQAGLVYRGSLEKPCGLRGLAERVEERDSLRRGRA